MLIYGLDERQFRRIERIQTGAYASRDFRCEEALADSVAHATYSVNGPLTAEHLEKLTLLFDVFEVQNGSRGAIHQGERHLVACKLRWEYPLVQNERVRC